MGGKYNGQFYDLFRSYHQLADDQGNTLRLSEREDFTQSVFCKNKAEGNLRFKYYFFLEFRHRVILNLMFM